MTTLQINGQTISVQGSDDTPLLWAIRDEIGLKGTKYSCGIGMCGACTVHVNGRAIRSCITTVRAVAGAATTTIEGLDPAGQHPLQKAWIELQVHNAATAIPDKSCRLPPCWWTTPTRPTGTSTR
jgi:isoquinoline 1-oxidoreductase alpha subunit